MHLRVINKFDVSHSKPFGTLISPSLKLDLNPNSKKVGLTLYKGMIGSLYLTTSRFDIMLIMCLCTRYQVDPKESHFSTIKCIMRYLLGT